MTSLKRSTGPWFGLAGICVMFVGCDARTADVSGMLGPVENGIIFTGHIYPHRYNTHRDRAGGHHAIVWRGGRVAEKALIEADFSDLEVQDYLESIGLVPGDNLHPDGWRRRDDPDSSEPDWRVDGPLLSVRVEWDGLDAPVPLAALFRETADDDIEIRFGGHRDYVPIWRSGCVLCMFSCPGGRTSNARYTLRQQTREQRSFEADETRLPPDGTPVRVTFRIAEPATGPTP